MTNEEYVGLVASNAELGGKIDGLRALVEADQQRRGEEIKALFAKARETNTTVQDIRVDYTPKRDFRDHVEDNRKDHATFSGKLEGLQWKLAVLCGGISLAAFGLNMLVRWIGAK